MIKNDIWIEEKAGQGMINPFSKELVNKSIGQTPILSYGLSSFGYDIRLSPKEFKVFKNIPGKVIDPKKFDPNHLESVELYKDGCDRYFILPAHSYGLGVALERLEIPSNISVICIGKSTYARVGLIANLTPVQAGWKGHLTLEFSNSSGADCRIYANEGIVQLLFFEGEQCQVSYGDRKGKYQDQSESITLPK